MVTVAAIHIQDLDEDALAGLEVSRRIHPALVAQFFKGNVALHAKQVDEDSCTDGRDNSGFRANTGIDAVVAVPVCAEIHFFSSGTHSLKTARRCNTGFGIDAFYDVIDFGAEALGQHVMKYLVRVTPAIIFGRLHCFGSRNDDFELTVIQDCKGMAWVIRRLFHTLDRPGQDTAASLRLDEVEQIILGLIRLRFDRRTIVNGQYRHARFGVIAFSLGFWRRIDAVFLGIRCSFRFCVRLGRFRLRLLAPAGLFYLGLGFRQFVESSVRNSGRRVVCFRRICFSLGERSITGVIRCPFGR